MKLRIEPNPNEKVYAKMREAVEKAGFTCPCFLFRDITTEEGKDHICICKEFREMMPKEGEKECYCHCKLYRKVVVDE